MAKFQLSLTADYVSSWGTWEALREIIQNGLDAQQDGRAFVFDRLNDSRKTLRFITESIKLERKVWLLGTSSKGDGSYRGHFGEGLKLAMLVLARSGAEVRIINSDETWIPSMEYSEEFGAQVLTITTRKLPTATGCFEIQVRGISGEDWALAQSRFLDMDPSMNSIDGCSYGSVLLDESKKGSVYVKGIFIQQVPKLSYGYNLLTVETDRDRGMIESYNMSWALALLWRRALLEHPDIIDTIYNLLKEEAVDVERLALALTHEQCNLLGAEFIKRHGPHSIPVIDEAAAREAEHWGVAPVIVSRKLADVLWHIDALCPAKVKELVKSKVTRVYALNSLPMIESLTLRTACALLAPAAERLQLPLPLDHVEVVEFSSTETLGMYDNTGDRLKIGLARDLLQSLPKTIQVLAHEMAHARGTDGDVNHERAEGELFGIALAAHAKSVEAQLLPGS
jgi:hypothetical protein